MSYSAYLCLTESRTANTRLFFGVERKTQMKKSQNAENLSVLHIVFISEEEPHVDYGTKPQFHIKTEGHLFLLHIIIHDDTILLL